MKKYISYEEGSNGTFTEKEMQTLYTEQVNKKEYLDYKSWLNDMLKSGVFEEMRTWVCYYINSRGNEKQKVFHNLEEGLNFTKLLDKKIEKGTCRGYNFTEI